MQHHDPDPIQPSRAEMAGGESADEADGSGQTVDPQWALAVTKRVTARLYEQLVPVALTGRQPDRAAYLWDRAAKQSREAGEAMPDPIPPTDAPEVDSKHR
jgi:hypothetical protein